VRRVLLVSAAAVLLLSACGSSDPEAAPGNLDDVTVSAGGAPKVGVSKGFSVDKTVSRVLTEGSGPEVQAGEAIKVNYVAVNGRTGKQFDSSFTNAKPLTVDLVERTILPGFIKGLEGRKLGTRVLVAIAPKDGFGQAQAQMDIKKDDTLVFLFDLVSKVPTEASGKAVKLPKDLPKLTYDADKHPNGFKKTSSTAARQTEPSAHVVIEGDGPVIAKGQAVRFEYAGQVYPDGTKFDESWSKADPFIKPVGTGQLIACWDQLLPGQKIGSRVVLVCPSKVAYGDDPDDPNRSPDIKAGDTLLFAIDLLDAS
jgi:FKBP-type peptidyl-prolyl cis-trans isomerase